MIWDVLEAGSTSLMVNEHLLGWCLLWWLVSAECGRLGHRITQWTTQMFFLIALALITFDAVGSMWLTAFQ